MWWLAGLCLQVVEVMDAQIANVEQKLRLEREALAALEDQKHK